MNEPWVADEPMVFKVNLSLWYCRRCRRPGPRKEWRAGKPIDVEGRDGRIWHHRCGYRKAIAEASIIATT